MNAGWLTNRCTTGLSGNRGTYGTRINASKQEYMEGRPVTFVAFVILRGTLASCSLTKVGK